MPKDKEAAKSKSAAKARLVPPANVVPANGAADLPSVHVDSYNLELQDQEGFIGDRASNRAFRAILDEWRQRLDEIAKDPLPDTPTEELSKKKIDKLLESETVEARGLIHSVIEDFAQVLAGVIKRFVRSKGWQDVERIVVGGGLRQSKTGELAISRAALLLKGKGNGLDVTLVPIHHHPDEAGLIGAAHLAPSWIFAGHDAMLAADIGGTNMRAGIVSLNLKRNTDLSAAEVWKYELWRHRDNKPSREEAVDRLARMVNDLIKAANKKVKLAPFLGIGCPGLIDPDGSIKRGGQNLPGNWESERFNLAQKLIERLKPIDDHPPSIVIHNDAVVQGLSEVPFMQDVKRWGVITIGTGLGNAVFTNNAKPKKS